MNKLYNVISETFELDASKINPTDNIIDYENWDSMTHMVLITTLEDEFEIEFTGDEIIEMKTVEDIQNILSKKNAKL